MVHQGQGKLADCEYDPSDTSVPPHKKSGTTTVPDLDSNGRYKLATHGEPAPYYKPTHQFGMGGTAHYGKDQPIDTVAVCDYPPQDVEWGLSNDMFMECKDACPPMAITPICEHGARTLYSAACDYSAASPDYWNMAVKEPSIKLTRVFGTMEPSTAPHAMDSIKCDNWTLTLRFIGPKEKVNKLNFYKTADKVQPDYFFIKAKWGFVADKEKPKKNLPPAKILG